jgi:uncharacterized protein (TIGR00255 family)
MTGYGRAEGSLQGLGLCVELRSVNHRYTDVRLGLPREWLALEVEVERRIRQGIGRGRVECSVRLGAGAGEVDQPILDAARARHVHQLYLDMARELGLEERPTLGLIARTEGVLAARAVPSDPEVVRVVLLPLLEAALVALEQMRTHEGEALRREIEGLLAEVARTMAEVRAGLPAESRAAAERFAERLRTLLAGAELPEERIAQELALCAERADVTEELARMDAHLIHFRDMLARGGPVGRELDFLLQEMNREVNTLCSKFHAPDVVRLAVSVKACLERIREQVQNVE